MVKDLSQMEQKPNLVEYVEQMSQLLDLPLEPEYQSGVVDNMTKLAAIASLVMQFPLPANIEAAPVFKP